MYSWVICLSSAHRLPLGVFLQVSLSDLKKGKDDEKKTANGEAIEEERKRKNIKKNKARFLRWEMYIDISNFEKNDSDP